MIVTILELAAFAAFTIAAYLLGGPVAALCVFGVVALVVALALDSEPKRPRARRIPKRPKTILLPRDEPVTNAEFDELMGLRPYGDT